MNENPRAMHVQKRPCGSKLMNGLPVQPTAQLVVLFCSWHKSKNPHLPRLNATTQVEFVSGRFGSKKRKKKSL
jgi:hypothetical protein